MSQYRNQLIQEGRLVTVQAKQATERIAKQLFNVAKRTEGSQDSVVPEDITWEQADGDIKAVFLAMARYVVSTYTENDRLRQKIRHLERRNALLPLDPHDDSIPV